MYSETTLGCSDKLLAPPCKSTTSGRSNGTSSTRSTSSFGTHIDAVHLTFPCVDEEDEEGHTAIKYNPDVFDNLVKYLWSTKL